VKDEIQWKTHPAIRRHEANPVLSAKDVPYDAGLVFNAGVTKYQGRYVMVFRNDLADLAARRLKGTIHLGIAFSRDGIRWEVENRILFPDPAHPFYRAYDPRLTVLDGRLYLCFALAGHGTRGGLAVTDDLHRWETLSISAPDNRNMVLFPEKIEGKFFRLERPFPIYSRSRSKDRFDTWYSDSPDCKYWGNSGLLFAVEHVPFANDKVGPGAPPVKTPKGWLTAFHAVDLDPSRGKNGWEKAWRKRYTAGIMLLDLNDPRKVIGMSKEPLLAPEAPYEISGGMRNNVIFPGGMILEKSGEVKIYYGAADTVECLATADVGDLLKLCKPVDWKIAKTP